MPRPGLSADSMKKSDPPTLFHQKKETDIPERRQEGNPGRQWNKGWQALWTQESLHPAVYIEEMREGF